MTIEHTYITTLDGEKREISWEELTQLKKDILWVFDECVGDLHNPFIPDESFKTSYWEYLRLKGERWFNDKERKFYKQGVLVVILCMTVEYTDTVSGNQRLFGNTKIDEVLNYVCDFEPVNADEKKLKDTVRLGLDVAGSMTESDLKNADGFNHPDLAKLHGQLDWVDRTFVKAYFKERAK